MEPLIRQAPVNRRCRLYRLARPLRPRNRGQRPANTEQASESAEGHSIVQRDSAGGKHQLKQEKKKNESRVDKKGRRKRRRSEPVSADVNNARRSPRALPGGAHGRRKSPARDTAVRAHNGRDTLRYTNGPAAAQLSLAASRPPTPRGKKRVRCSPRGCALSNGCIKHTWTACLPRSRTTAGACAKRALHYRAPQLPRGTRRVGSTTVAVF